MKTDQRVTDKYNYFKKGFSLVELLVVITIIAILSVTAYIALGGQTAKARNAKRKEALGTIESALEIYAVGNNNKYPDNGSLGVDLAAAGLMDELPLDPSSLDGGPDINYMYRVNTTNNKSYQLAVTLEDETGGDGLEAHVIGNGSGLLTGIGDTIAAGVCNDTNDCDIDDGATDCVPYCL